VYYNIHQLEKLAKADTPEQKKILNTLRFELLQIIFGGCILPPEKEKPQLNESNATTTRKDATRKDATRKKLPRKDATRKKLPRKDATRKPFFQKGGILGMPLAFL